MFITEFLFLTGTRYVSRDCIRRNSYTSVDNMGCIKCEQQDEGDSCKTKTITCYCDEDNCNHGNMNSPFLLYVLAMASLKLILM